MIAIVDYDGGNTCSVMNSLSRLDVDFTLTNDAFELQRASKVILPGVGHAGKCMESLRRLNLVEVLSNIRNPFLGICVGMQLMYQKSEEGNTVCLGLVEGNVKKFVPKPNADFTKVPHMGWNQVYHQDSKLFTGINSGSYFYFVHSFYGPISAATTAECSYNHTFTAAIQQNNYYGVQFHPEKSGTMGEIILQNFAKL